MPRKKVISIWKKKIKFWERPRQVFVLLHRKHDANSDCYCGAIMVCVGGTWVCPIQMKNKDPNFVWINYSKLKKEIKEAIKNG